MTGLELTLVVALAAALVLGAIAHRLGVPPMVGYVVAGLVVGPATPGFVAAREDVLALADVGVALLMFSIGLRFSLAELRSVGVRILAGTPVQVAATMAIGTGTGLALGWPVAEALFIGGALAVCSTVVLFKIGGEDALHTTVVRAHRARRLDRPGPADDRAGGGAVRPRLARGRRVCFRSSCGAPWHSAS